MRDQNRDCSKPFVIQKEALSKEDCNALLNTSAQRSRYYRSASKLLNRRVDIAHVNCETAPLLLQAILGLGRKSNVWKLTLSDVSFDMRVQRYRKGDYTDLHTDYDPATGDFSKLTIVIPLVDRSEWRGGILQIGNSLVTPQLDSGDAVIFPSFSPHCVTNVVSGARIVLSAWILGPSLR